MKVNYKTVLLILLLLLIQIAIFSYKINREFIGHHDAVPTSYGLATRYYLRYGLFNTKLGVVTDVNKMGNKIEFKYSFHHPSLSTLLMTPCTYLFGTKEWALRLTPILFSLGCIIIFYLLARLFFSKILSVLAISFLIMTPMMAYFGKNASSISLFFIFFVIYYYLKWQNSNKKIFLYLFFIGLVLGELTDWIGFHIPLVIIPYHLFFSKTKKRNFIISIIIISIIIFLILLSHIYILGGNKALLDLFEIFKFRIGLDSPTYQSYKYKFTIKEFLLREHNRSLELFTPILWYIGLFWGLFICIISIIRKKISQENKVIGIFLILGLSLIFMWVNMAWIHDFRLFYTAPFFALAPISLVNLFIPKTKKFTQIGCCIIVLLLMTPYSITTIKAFYEKNIHKEYYELGTFLNQNSKPDERSIGNCRKEEIDYYTDRFWFWAEPKNIKEQIETKNYKFIVLEDFEKIELNLQNYFLNKGKLIKKIDRYIIFDLAPPPEYPRIVENFEEKDSNILSHVIWKLRDCNVNLEQNIKTEGNSSLKINFEKNGEFPAFYILYNTSMIYFLENDWSPYTKLEFDIYPKDIQLDKIHLHISHPTGRLIDGNKYTLKDFSINGEQLKQWHHIKINFNNLKNQEKKDIISLQFFVVASKLDQENNIIYLDNIQLN